MCQQRSRPSPSAHIARYLRCALMTYGELFTDFPESKPFRVEGLDFFAKREVEIGTLFPGHYSLHFNRNVAARAAL